MNIIERIENNSTPVIIAEVGVNHEGSLKKAKELMVLAASAGADIVKYQSYTLERYTSLNDLARVERLRRFCLDQEEFKELYGLSKELNIGFLSTPVTEDWVENLNPYCSEFKIASGDFTFKVLIEKVLNTGKPIILSTGGCSEKEIDTILNWIRLEIAPQDLKKRVVLLHCVSAYPTPIEQANIRSIQYLSERYDVNVGYSNHVIGLEASLMAVALGASVIEVHFTDNKHGREFRDHALSFDKNDLEEFVSKSRLYAKALGYYNKTVQPCEEDAPKLFRKGIVASHDLLKGETLKKENLMFARPATEFRACELDSLIGKKLNMDVKSGHLIPRDSVECVA